MLAGTTVREVGETTDQLLTSEIATTHLCDGRRAGLPDSTAIVVVHVGHQPSFAARYSRTDIRSTCHARPTLRPLSPRALMAALTPLSLMSSTVAASVVDISTTGSEYDGLLSCGSSAVPIAELDSHAFSTRSSWSSSARSPEGSVEPSCL
jgi:hypothetical protein